jgi:hypothetical protein
LAALALVLVLQQIVQHKAVTAYFQQSRQPEAVKAVQDKETLAGLVGLVVVQVVEQVQPEERLRLHRRKATTAAIIQREMPQVQAVEAEGVLVLSVVMEAETILTAYQAQAVQD